jgi:hypothetical protein
MGRLVDGWEPHLGGVFDMLGVPRGESRFEWDGTEVPGRDCRLAAF